MSQAQKKKKTDSGAKVVAHEPAVSYAFLTQLPGSLGKTYASLDHPSADSAQLSLLWAWTQSTTSTRKAWIPLPKKQA